VFSARRTDLVAGYEPRRSVERCPQERLHCLRSRRCLCLLCYLLFNCMVTAKRPVGRQTGARSTWDQYRVATVPMPSHFLGGTRQPARTADAEPGLRTVDARLKAHDSRPMSARKVFAFRVGRSRAFVRFDKGPVKPERQRSANKPS
jgi:hypothetical protein